MQDVPLCVSCAPCVVHSCCTQDMQSYFEYYGFAKDVFRIVQFEE